MEKVLWLKDEVYQIIGCAFEVYNHLGPGIVETVYDRGIPFDSQKSLNVFYKGKALNNLMRRDSVQVLNYLRATHSKVGVLINFGSPAKLEWKRYVL